MIDKVNQIVYTKDRKLNKGAGEDEKRYDQSLGDCKTRTKEIWW